MSMINDRGDGDENGDENDDDNDDHGDSVIHFVSKSHSQSVSQSVSQSFCHHSITKSESKCRILKSIKIIQLTWKIVKALTNVAEMNCVENLKSKFKK